MSLRTLPIPAAVALLFTACGGGDPAGEDAETGASPGKEKAAAEETVPPEAPRARARPTIWSEVTLHEAIRSKNPGYTGNGQFRITAEGQPQAILLDSCGITDLSPLEGMPLLALDLRGDPVADLSPLAGMPLVELYLENTAVDDLSPLKENTTLRKLYLSGTIVSDLEPLTGLPIVELNLVNARVEDVTALGTMPLQMLWLTDTPVEDISPLARCPLVSLTLHRTQVADLSPLADTRLQRLHIAETPVTDLTPLANLPLTRLVFTPDRIEKGMHVIRAMPSLREIGTQFDDGGQDLVPPAQFWAGRE